MRFVFVFLLLQTFLFAMPCGGLGISCGSVPSGYVGLCLGDYNILSAYVDYGYGNIQLQNMGITCDAPASSSGSPCVSISPGGDSGSSFFDWEKTKQGFRDSNDIFLWIFACFVIVKMFGLIK